MSNSIDGDSARRRLAERLAELLGSESELAILQLLSGGNAPPPSTESVFRSLSQDAEGYFESQAEGPPMVGIWQSAEDGGFVRSRAHRDLWGFCADVDRIPPKGPTRRVVLLGESVARGFFFDPVYNPAGVLSEILWAAGERVEVVDLAQSNIDDAWLAQLAAAALQLEPDVFVVVAGNNWRSAPLSASTVEQCAEFAPLLTRDGGMARIRQSVQEQLEKRAAQSVETLGSIAASAGVPLVLVVPEINVADWSSRPAGTADLPSSSGAATAAWAELLRSTRTAIEAGRFKEASDYAARMTELDAGLSATSLELLGRAKQGLGETEAASLALRASRDMTLAFLDDSLRLPGAFSFVADTIRTSGADCGAELVDLPAEFPTGSRDRRFFLDYCHFTSTGMQWAMAAVAQTLLSISGRSPERVEALCQTAPGPEPLHEGWAHLLAAIHNAHWGQPVEICTHHVRRAVEVAPRLREDALAQLYEAFRHDLPPALTASFEELVRFEQPRFYLVGYALHYRELGPMQEHRLLRALMEVEPSLRDRNPDPVHCLGEIEDLDLLQAAQLEFHTRHSSIRRAFFVASDPRTRFSFASLGALSLRLHVVHRIPGSLANSTLRVLLNGTPAGEIETSSSWQSADLDMGTSRPGLNELVLLWDQPLRCDLRSNLRNAFERGRPVDLRTHFGHLFELRLSVRRVG